MNSLRHRAALDRVDELVALARLGGSSLSQTWPYWPRPPDCLTNLPSASTDLRDRLAVRDLRLADVGLDAELALHAVDDDLEVQLAHAGDDRLARFLVGVHAERRVFLRQALQRHAHLFLVGLGLRLDRDARSPAPGTHLFEDDRPCSRRTACRRWSTSFRPTAAAMSPARTSLISSRLLACICSRRPMRSLLALGRVVDRVARLEHARVHAEERQLADVRVGHDLERQRGERLVVVGAARGRLAVLGRRP